MSTHKNTPQPHKDHFFSFSRSKNNSRELTQPTTRITPLEQRGIVGWVSALLHPFGEEFTRALKSSQARGVVGLNSYIAANYPHLKEIVRYFIIATLDDEGWLDWQEQPARKASGDVLLDILIEELGGRFFRESQWLVKIMHLPLYEIFAKIDTFAKGYITLRELAAYAGITIDLQAPSTAHITAKLKGNLGGYIKRIHQQNLRETQLRVDITSFTQENLHKGSECSQTYARIYSTLKAWGERVEKERADLQKLQAESSKMHMENLEMSREDLRIRSVSRKMMENQQTPARLLVQNEPSSHRFAQNDHSRTKNSARAHLSKDTGERPTLTLEDLHHSPISASNEQTHIMKEKQERSKRAIELSALQAQTLHAKQHQKLLIRAAILNQLQSIKFAKFHNRHHLFTYI